MDHSAVISQNPDGFGRPFHVQCSCNTAGDFNSQQEASDWITYQHFSRLGPTETFSLTPNVPADLSAPTTESAPASETSGAGPVQETVGDA